MALETGTATDVYDLLDKLRQFALGQGWTVNRFANGDELCLESAGGFWNIHAFDNMGANFQHLSGYQLDYPGWIVASSTGFDAGLAWDAQPNTPATEAGLGAFEDTDVKAYWFFSDTVGSYIHVAARILPERYTTLHIGHLDKLGTWTGGAYAAATLARGDTGDGFAGAVSFANGSPGSGHVRADIDGATDSFQELGFGNELRSLGAFNRYGTGDLYFPLLTAGPATWNGRSPMLPCYWLLQRPSTRYAVAGYPSDVRVLNIELLPPERTVVVGSDEWIIFPFGRKTGQVQIGTAYRKVP